MLRPSCGLPAWRGNHSRWSAADPWKRGWGAWRRTWRRLDLYWSFNGGFPCRRNPERPRRHRAIRVSWNAPLALLEAYAAGRPVIGSRIAGIPELVREEETGTLYPTGDVEALADALVRFAELPDARVLAMGAAARAGWNVISMRPFISCASLTSTALSRRESDKE